MLTKIASAAIVGLEAKLVTIEVDIQSQGLPHFIIVGLPDKSVDESKERVRSAIKNSGFEFPNKKITVNMAPADVFKEGSRFDLPLALGILAASGQINNTSLDTKLFYGELSLDGTIKPVRGSVLIAISAKEAEIQELYVPADNAAEARIIEGSKIYACQKLSQLANYFNEKEILTSFSYIPAGTIRPTTNSTDIAEVRGQLQAKRALEISAAGGHNCILIGNPGAGKTLLAKTFPSILPDITPEESIELTKLYSISGYLDQNMPIITERPFRHPHHTGSVSSIVGGGSNPKPGEISLAHRGVLFLDEFLEFPKAVLESLRQPLEDGTMTVSRAALTVTFPAKFILLAACNPCPCGYAFSTEAGKQCTCSQLQLANYQKKLSGPILDRIDLQIKIRSVPVHELTQLERGESSQVIRDRVQAARSIQKERLTGLHKYTNGEMTSEEVQKLCSLSGDAAALMSQAAAKMNLSARSYFRTIKVAQTIADLAGETVITQQHVAESLQYRLS